MLLVPGKTAPAADRVALGFGPSITSALDVIADSQGFFAMEGLQAELREFSRGSKAMEALFEGQVDLASSTAFAVVSNSFTRSDFRIVTTVAVAGNDNRVLARRDRGILAVKDLKGKRVGSFKGGMTSYVLELLILQGGMSAGDVDMVYGEPEQLTNDLIAGNLDALCAFGTWFDKAQKALGAGGVVFTDESLVRVTTCMTALKSRIEAAPALFAKVIRAYIRAEEYIKANPDHALEIVAGRFKLDREAARKLWKPNLFHVSLDQSMIGDMENMARWQLASGGVKADRIPNFLDFIWFRLLEEIDPTRVSIIH